MGNHGEVGVRRTTLITKHQHYMLSLLICTIMLGEHQAPDQPEFQPRKPEDMSGMVITFKRFVMNIFDSPHVWIKM